MKYILHILLLLFSILYSETGYLRTIEVSFCMDECAQYYLETEVDPGFGSINVIPENSTINMELYINRFVEVDLGDEVECVECNAFQINSINLSNDCQYPVSCFADPCEVADECEVNTPINCLSNYCGGCYADFYDLEGNLIECGELLFDNCQDLSGLFFGWCDMYLGVAIINGECEHVSGCGWTIDGFDYTEAFFQTIEECEQICNNQNMTCDEIAESYELLHGNNYNTCEFDNDCTAVWGHCNIGLGGCHYSVNEQDYPEDNINQLVSMWIEENCEAGVCDCAGKPYAQCIDGTCTSAYCMQENPAGCFQTGCDEGYQCVDDPNTCTPSSCWCSGFYGEWYCTEDCGGGICQSITLGDINQDSQLDIIDIVLIINFITGNNNPTDNQIYLADINIDGSINILDIVLIVQIILET